MEPVHALLVKFDPILSLPSFPHIPLIMPIDSLPILGKIIRFLKGLSWFSPLLRSLVKGLKRWIVSQLRALAVLTEDPSLVHSTGTVLHGHL